MLAEASCNAVVEKQFNVSRVDVKEAGGGERATSGLATEL